MSEGKDLIFKGDIGDFYSHYELKGYHFKGISDQQNNVFAKNHGKSIPNLRAIKIIKDEFEIVKCLWKEVEKYNKNSNTLSKNYLLKYEKLFIANLVFGSYLIHERIEMYKY